MISVDSKENTNTTVRGDASGAPTVLLVTALADDLLRFRFPILRALLQAGCRVVACAAKDDPLAGVLQQDIPAVLGKLDITYRTFPLQRTGMNPLLDLRSLLALFTVCRKVRPDIVLCCNAKPIVWGSLGARLAGVPSINSLVTGLGFGVARNSGKQGMGVQIARWLYRLALSTNRTVIFQNEDDRDEMVQARLVPASAQPGVVNGSGVDIEAFTPAPFPEGPPVFLIISRLLGEKGVGEFAEAAALVKAQYPEAIFRIVGPSDNTHSDAISEEQVHGWEAAGVLTWHGQTSDVRRFIAQAHVYVLPSYHEGTPRTVLEAMAMGRPIITTDAPGCRQTVADGENGYLVPVKDAGAVARAMIKFLQNPSLLATMGARSRQRAVEKYDGRLVGRDVVRWLGITTDAAEPR